MGITPASELSPVFPTLFVVLKGLNSKRYPEMYSYSFKYLVLDAPQPSRDLQHVKYDECTTVTASSTVLENLQIYELLFSIEQPAEFVHR